MKVLRTVLLVLMALATCAGGSAARAGDGFPPMGAWAYGSYPTHGHHLHTARHYGPIGSVGWTGYGMGSLGYSGIGSVRYRAHVGGIHGAHIRYRSVVHRYPSYRAGFYLPSYSAFYVNTSYVFPTFFDSYYAAPVYAPTYLPACGYPLASPVSCDCPAACDCDIQQPASPALPISTFDVTSDDGVKVYHTARPNAASGSLPVTPASGLFVSQSSGVGQVPEELLDAADQIFRAGGYREAAVAYAQLAVRFGSSNVLFGRRFIAQIAVGDLEQAVVIASSAELAGLELAKSTLPEGSLNGLGLPPLFIAEKSEALAKNAYHHIDDADPLLALGRWLHLAGDEQLSQVFLARARQLGGVRPTNATPQVALTQDKELTASSKSELVSLE